MQSLTVYFYNSNYVCSHYIVIMFVGDEKRKRPRKPSQKVKENFEGGQA